MRNFCFGRANDFQYSAVYALALFGVVLHIIGRQDSNTTLVYTFAAAHAIGFSRWCCDRAVSIFQILLAIWYMCFLFIGYMYPVSMEFAHYIFLPFIGDGIIMA